VLHPSEQTAAPHAPKHLGVETPLLLLRLTLLLLLLLLLLALNVLLGRQQRAL
jgi:hypothetical protein